jgi:hypothetical protein
MYVDHDDYHHDASFNIALAIIAIAVTFLAYAIR